MKTRILVYSALLTLGTAGAALAQSTPANPLSAGAKKSYDIIKGYVLKAAEKMPEEHYAFKPTPDVRSFGQLVGHISDANFVICGMVSGEKPPAGGFEPAVSIEQTKKTKAELSKALADSFAFCDKALAAMTNDVVGGQDVTMTVINNMKTTRAGAFAFNSAHDMEHYGNLVTYMRINKIVPPSSAPPAK